ncbi:hypothetical protein VTN00DRAFT_9085 [Thermoascus crustaceus]|uniref:uncharacterized protein n=1 Tax=Thermoascus crustaceus TaxID=5088 RepID=UPI003741F902
MAHDARDSQSQPADSANPANGLLRKKSEITLLEPPVIRPGSGQSETSRSPVGDDRRSVGRPRSGTVDSSAALSQGVQPSTSEGPSRDRPSTPNVRTLPAWIRSVEYTEDEGDATTHLLPSHPDDALVAQHNHSPHSKNKPDFSHTRDESLDHAAPKTGGRESRWKNFSKAIAYPRITSMEEKLVTPEWLNQNFGDYSQPYGGLKAEEDVENQQPRRRRTVWFKRLQKNLLQSPIVPLIFRLTVWVFSLTALALGGSIQHLATVYKHPQGPSAIMAIVVDAVALVYLVYITWDEYTGKPLGLRPPRAKMRLMLLDLFFIVFDSANLGLAFESLSDITSSCTAGEVNRFFDPRNDQICDRQKALASVLLIALIAWLMTFSISVLRLVERVSQK